jgi:hypothetical protein
VQWDDFDELHYITPMENVASILERGVLSHRLAGSVPHRSVADEDVQAIRARTKVLGSAPLHTYANAYFTARNPMLYVRLAQHRDICVLRIRKEVIDIAGTVITDGNASSKWTRFSAGRGGLAIVEKDRTFAEYWTDSWDTKRRKCAEVLAPGRIPADYIVGAYVSCAASLESFDGICDEMEGEVNRALFFNCA